MSDTEQALSVYRDDYNCAQAICSVYGARFGLDDKMAKMISCGFGAGIGRTGGMCGAVAGAIMVLGLKYGMADSANLGEKKVTYEKVQEFMRCFEEKHGSTRCPDLLGCDISTSEGFEKAVQEDLLVTVCEELVVDAAKILEGLL